MQESKSTNSASVANTDNVASLANLSGGAWKFADNIDTDVIIAARYLNTSDENALAKHIMEDARPDFASIIKKGDFIVAGENFGCGSSREHAPLALKAAGIACVIAPSFARIFYRNAFNMGLLILECEDSSVVASIDEGDILEADLAQGKVFNRSKNSEFAFKPIPAFMLELLQSGGLIQYAKKIS